MGHASMRAIMTTRDKPWLFRTYAGHSTAADSNKLFRTNLSKGQTGLSVAFDLPTQTGYDSDHVLARGEVGKVGVPVSHIGDMRTLFDQIPLATMNTSMTINATAAWLLALYVAVAEEQGATAGSLSGTTQNDIIKEYLSRGTYVFPPGALDAADHRHHRLLHEGTAEVEPDERLQLSPAGSRCDAGQELSFALATAFAVLDGVKAGGQWREGFPGGLRAHLVLRQCRHPLRHRAVQDARLHGVVGRDRPRALWHHG